MQNERYNLYYTNKEFAANINSLMGNESKNDLMKTLDTKEAAHLELYHTDDNFKNYLDRYMTKHKCALNEAIKHEIVHSVYEEYKYKKDNTKL